ncbi:MAG: hypothetical protein KJO82_10475 [Gammaproteobacteria bacterium]|nr:hypothetical protein [Gammaproteobacteria bacterium]
MSSKKPTLKDRTLRELALFLGLLLFGLVLLPVSVYLVGEEVFGEFAGAGFGEFFRTLSGKLRDGNSAAWFLVLSPYMALLVLRLTGLAWRLTRAPGSGP